MPSHRAFYIPDPDYDLVQPFLRPLIRESDSNSRVLPFRVVDDRYGNARRRFFDIDIASEIDSYKYEQLRMELLKAVIFYLDEGPWQKEFKHRGVIFSRDPDELLPTDRTKREIIRSNFNLY